MNHSLNYSNYIEKIKSENSPFLREEKNYGNSVISNDPGADHFDPVTFYSSLDDAATVKTVPNPPTLPNTTSSTPNLRRSGRPKPAAESLMSSPPAIKFYESTVIRNKPTAAATKTTKKSSLTESSSGNSTKNGIDMKTEVNEASPMLKLRLPMSSTSSSLPSTSSKENISDKRNLRVVKLMMPDITAEEPEEDLKLSSASALKVASAKVGSSVKTATTASIASNNSNKVALPVLAPKLSNPNSSKPLKPSKPLRFADLLKIQQRAKSKPSTTSLVNEDVCGSCGGLGNFICCDACPRSFHFTCAQPPLDPLNLPSDDWFCSECRHDRFERNESGPAKDNAGIWGMMRREAGRMNPKCFVMPRRFRYQPKEDDLQKLLSAQLIQDDKPKEPVKVINQNNTQTPHTQPHHTQITPHNPIVINETVTMDHCALKTPNISSLKPSHGYCHCCSRYGLTRSALQKSSEDPSIPCDLRLQRPILSCNVCPLYWHLDCLDPPRASFPSNADAGWTCPIHFTTEKCLALELAESLVQATLLLPEDAIKRQFEHKIKRRRDECVPEDNEQLIYGISEYCVHVPDVIKQFYKQ